MALKLNTGNTGYAVTAKADGSLYSNIFGTGNYVLSSGDQLSATLNSNNTEITFGSGDVMMGGRHGYIAYDDSDSVSISSGATGYNRIDLVCVHYQKDSSGIESMALAVIEGTATTGTPEAPGYTAGDITSGATESYFPIYQVTFTGLDAKLTALFTVKENMETLNNEVGDFSSNLFPRYDVLWENEDSSVAMAATEITLEKSISNYSMLLFRVRRAYNNAAHNYVVILPIIDNVDYLYAVTTATNVQTRTVTITSDTVLTLSRGYNGSSQNNNVCIPEAIYGLR